MPAFVSHYARAFADVIIAAKLDAAAIERQFDDFLARPICDFENKLIMHLQDDFCVVYIVVGKVFIYSYHRHLHKFRRSALNREINQFALCSIPYLKIR